MRKKIILRGKKTKSRIAAELNHTHEFASTIAFLCIYMRLHMSYIIVTCILNYTYIIIVL